MYFVRHAFIGYHFQHILSAFVKHVFSSCTRTTRLLGVDVKALISLFFFGLSLLGPPFVLKRQLRSAENRVSNASSYERLAARVRSLLMA